MKKLLLLFTISVVSLNLYAIRVDKVPLQQLIDSSEYIFYGTVISTSAVEKAKEQELAAKYDYWIYCNEIEYVAKLKVLKKLKGELIFDTVSITYRCGYNGYCGGYVPNDTIVTFLDRHPDGSFFRRSCHFGIKSFGPEQYADRVNDYLSIDRNVDSIKYVAAILEWHLKCAEGYYTCDEGMFFLKDHNIRNFGPEGLLIFDEIQKQRLTNALLGFQPFLGNHEELLELVGTFNHSPHLKEYIVNNLKRLEPNSAYLTAATLMAAYLKFDSRKKLKQLQHRYLKCGLYNYKELKNQFKIVREFVEELDEK